MIMKYLKRLIIAFVYLLPAALYCSYYPIIKLGETDSMNLELSLPLLWLVIFDIVSFIALIQLAVNRTKEKQETCRLHMSSKKLFATDEEQAKRGAPVTTGDDEAGFEKAHAVGALAGISDRRFFLFSLFPFFATISIFWSPNPTRAILTAGIIWLIFFAIFALIYVLPLLDLPGNFKRNCLRGFFIASVIACLICWVQSFLDIAGFAREETLMCRGCTYLSFGFPHPSGLAIEPQFMGNLLLAPTLTSLYLLIFDKKRSFTLLILSLLFSSTLFLTFSRGAIYAYVIALGVMLIFALRRHVFRASLLVIPVATFLTVISVQGIFTVLGPTHGGFFDGVSKSIHQLSLGVIDFRSKTPSGTTTNPSETTPDSSPEALEAPSSSNPSTDQALTETTPQDLGNAQNQPFFEGYVVESTTARLDLNQAAIDTWLSAPGHPESGISVGLRCFKSCCPCTGSGPLTPTSVLFGVGLGGAGTAMYLNSFITGINSPKEIVQHQGFSLLLELGLVGVALAIFGLLVAFSPQLLSRKFLDGKSAGTGKAAPSAFWQHPALPLLASLIIAYLVTLNFFSGLPNALQIYLMPPLLYYIFAKNPCTES